jgi:threonyl-tRNA synthetase
VPYLAVVGRKEVEERSVNVNDRAGAQTPEPLAEFAERVALEVAERRR